MADASSNYGRAKGAAVAAFNDGIAAADDGWLESEETALADYEKAYWDAEWEWFLDVLEADADYETANADRAATPSVATNVYSATAIQRALESGEGQVFGEVFVLTLPDGRKAVYQLRRPTRMTSRGTRPDFNQPKGGTLYGVYPADYTPESAAAFVETNQGQVNEFLELFPEMSEPTINRIGAVGQLGLATVEGVGAVVSAPTGVGPVVLGAAAADDAGTAIVILWTGRPHRTLRNAAVYNTATFAGVPEEWAEGAGFVADVAPAAPAAYRATADALARHTARRAAATSGSRTPFRSGNDLPLDSSRSFDGTELQRSEDEYVNVMAHFEPRTPNLPARVSVEEILSNGYIPHQEGVTLTDQTVRFSDLWAMTQMTERKIEFGLVRTMEDGRYVYRVYSGGPTGVNTTLLGDTGRVVAHTHPRGTPPSPKDIQNLNNWLLRRVSEDPYAGPLHRRVITGPGPDDFLFYYPSVLR